MTLIHEICVETVLEDRGLLSQRSFDYCMEIEAACTAF